jgi:ubiquinol-cytochrome c reductase iron-sulfur subunit
MSTLLLGLGLAVSLLGIGIAAIHWSKTLMANREYIDERHPIASPTDVREAAVIDLKAGIEDSGIGRRGVLKGALLGAIGLFPLTIAVPLISSVGSDWNVGKFRHTIWANGTRLTTDPDGRALKATDLEDNQVVHIIPEVPAADRESHEWLTEKAKAMVLLVRLPAGILKKEQLPGAAYQDPSLGGSAIVAYSKVCTHVGCPVALYDDQSHHLLCPCHQSTFDIANGAKVIFGPAKRPLPQLPITVDADGYLVATSDFAEPVGPSFWERLR